MIIAIVILSWLFYAIGLGMKVFANQVRFMAAHDMPLIFSRSPDFAYKFWLTRLVVTYTSFVGFWFGHGLSFLVIAFLFYMLVCVLTFVIGSRRSVNKWARIELERQKQEAAQNGESFDEVGGWFIASKWAEKFVEGQISRNGNL